MITEISRGKVKENNEWVIGYHLNIRRKPYEAKPADIIVPHDKAILVYGEKASFYEVYPDTVSPFTGLTVANGQVFGGDILQFGDFKLEVFWNGEAFQWQARKLNSIYDRHFCYHCGYRANQDWTIIDLGNIAAEEIITGKMTTTIIGNIWDNADWLDRNKKKNKEIYTF